MLANSVSIAAMKPC